MTEYLNAKKMLADSKNTIGPMIRQSRRAAGLTQVDFANQAGISQPYLSNIENGNVSPSVNSLTAMVNVFESTGVLDTTFGNTGTVQGYDYPTQGGTNG